MAKKKATPKTKTVKAGKTTPIKANPFKGNDGGSGTLQFRGRPKNKRNVIEKITKRKVKEESSENKDVKEWLTKIQKALKVKRAWHERFRVETAYEYRDGAQRDSTASPEEWITINRIYSNLKSELPTLYSNDPYFFINLATTFDADPQNIPILEQKGKMRQSMLNYLKRELKLKEKVRLSVLDAHFQFGVAKTYYSADLVDNPKSKDQTTDDAGNPVFDEESGKPIFEPEQLPTNEAYKIKRLHPNDFFWDAEAGTLEDTWGFVGEIIKMPLDEAKDDKRYNKSARKRLKPTERASANNQQMEDAREVRKKGTLGLNKEPKADTVVIYEMYNLKKNEWFTISEGSSEYLIKPEKVPKGTENHPYSILRLGLLRDDSPYPVTPISQLLDPQKEFNELRSKILTHRKRFNRKYEMVDEAFDNPDAAASKLETGGDGTVMRRNGSFQGQAIFPISDASLDQNHIQELILLTKDFEELATGSNQRGSGAGVDSATEAGIIEKRAVMQEGDNLGLVMDFTTEIGRKTDQLVQAFITKDQAVKVMGPKGEFWEIIRTEDYEDIDGEFEYSVNTGSTIPQLPEIERAQWMQFLGLIATAPFLAAVKPLLKKMAEMHRIEDEAMVDGLHEIAKALLSQGGPPTGGASPPGGPDFRNLTANQSGGSQGIANFRGGA